MKHYLFVLFLTALTTSPLYSRSDVAVIMRNTVRSSLQGMINTGRIDLLLLLERKSRSNRNGFLIQSNNGNARLVSSEQAKIIRDVLRKNRHNQFFITP